MFSPEKKPTRAHEQDRAKKRARVEHMFEASEAQPHAQNEGWGDCFDDAVAGYLAHPDGTVRSDWLHRQDWMMGTDDYISVSNAAGDHGDGSLREQIHNLTRQLCEIKRRFGPEAQQCATACNANRSSNEGTTASREFDEARRMCNPFEELGQGSRDGGLNTMFMNRAAIKLANIDALLDFSLTQCDGLFLFADLCGAPGGFSEYLMKRCHSSTLHHSCLGYGMSLHGVNEHGRGVEWKLKHMTNAGDGTYVQYRICRGVDGTGDVYRWENVQALEQDIHSDPNLEGFVDPQEAGQVHVVVADGGFDAQRDSDHQEELAQKIIVCQASAALTLLRNNGIFVMKMFGFQTATIRCLMKYMFLAFEKIKVVKPISSRPASAERYVIFSGYKKFSGFDGSKWQNQILSGGFGEQEQKSDKLLSKFCDCLDMYDRDILRLNIKACFRILSYMEDKRTALIHGNDGWMLPKSFVDIQAYKRAWRLESQMTS